MNGAKETTPWRDGYWKAKSDDDHIHIVKGSDVSMKNLVTFLDNPDSAETVAKGTWEFGHFEEAPQELKEKSGGSQINIKLTYDFGAFGSSTSYGVLHESGIKCYAINHDEPLKKIEEYRWLDEDAIKKIADSFEDINDRSHPYKVQPENQGKLIFLTGAPGSGKSTTALKLAQKEGFVYYEGDAFPRMKNPYVPISVDEPSIATANQPSVKGLSKEVISTFSALGKFYLEDLPKGDISDQELAFPYFIALSQDIASEKAKIGGNWAVAFAAPTRKIRDVIKKECQATFVVLTVSQETQEQRVKGRHSEDDPRVIEWLTSMQQCFEPVQPDEKDAFDLIITPEMGKDEIVKKVLELTKIDTNIDFVAKPPKKKSSVCVII